MATWPTRVNYRLPGAEQPYTNEVHTIGEVDANRVYLTEAPLESASLVVTNAAGTLTYARVSGAPAVGQYFAYFSGALAGLLIFNAGDNGAVVHVDYSGRGTPVWAHIINQIQSEKLDRDGSIPMTGKLILAAAGVGFNDGTTMTTAARDLAQAQRDFFNIGGLQLLLEADRDGRAPGAVYLPSDYSGNNRNGTAGGASLKAGAPGVGGSLEWSLDISTQGVTIGYSVPAPSTIIACFAPLSASHGTYRLVDTSGNFLIGPYNSAYTIHHGGFINGSAIVAGLHKTMMAVIDGTGTRGYENNALIGSNGTTAAPGAINLGIAGSSTVPANSSTPLIAVFNKALSAAEANTVHAYIRAKFGLDFTAR